MVGAWVGTGSRSATETMPLPALPPEGRRPAARSFLHPSLGAVSQFAAAYTAPLGAIDPWYSLAARAVAPALPVSAVLRS